MGDSIAINFQEVDFESAVDEVDVLVPKYLDQLEALEVVEQLEEIPNAVQNVETYWNRLCHLFQQISGLEAEIPFDEIMKNSLQSELTVLEKVYLSVNLRIEFTPTQWTSAMWAAADVLLDRMDAVLEALGFDQEHEDRILVREMKQSNLCKQQQWKSAAKSAG